jgi:hypothetical protein
MIHEGVEYHRPSVSTPSSLSSSFARATRDEALVLAGMIRNQEKAEWTVLHWGEEKIRVGVGGFIEESRKAPPRPIVILATWQDPEPGASAYGPYPSTQAAHADVPRIARDYHGLSPVQDLGQWLAEEQPDMIITVEELIQ